MSKTKARRQAQQESRVFRDRDYQLWLAPGTPRGGFPRDFGSRSAAFRALADWRAERVQVLINQEGL